MGDLSSLSIQDWVSWDSVQAELNAWHLIVSMMEISGPRIKLWARERVSSRAARHDGAPSRALVCVYTFEGFKV